MALVQRKSANGAAGTTVPLTVAFTSNVTAGNAIVVTVQATSNRTFTVEDHADPDVDTYVVAIAATAGALDSQICYCKSAAGGATSVDVYASSDATTVTVCIYEVSDLDPTAPLEATGEFNDGAGATDHYSAASGGIDISSRGRFLVCAGATAATAGSNITPGADHTAEYASTRYIGQFREITGEVTDYRGPWTTANSVIGNACCAVFRGPAQSTWRPRFPLIQQGPIHTFGG